MSETPAPDAMTDEELVDAFWQAVADAENAEGSEGGKWAKAVNDGDRYRAMILAELARLRGEVERLTARHVANVKARDDARAEAEKATEARLAAEKRLDKLTYHLRVPDGAVRLDAWRHNGQLIVCGYPHDTDGDVDHPHAHNCDAMGCSTVSHVVIREKLNEWGTLAVRDEVDGLRGEVARLREENEQLMQTVMLGEEHAVKELAMIRFKDLGTANKDE